MHEQRLHQRTVKSKLRRSSRTRYGRELCAMICPTFALIIQETKRGYIAPTNDTRRRDQLATVQPIPDCPNQLENFREKDDGERAHLPAVHFPAVAIFLCITETRGTGVPRTFTYRRFRDGNGIPPLERLAIHTA